MKKKLMKIMTMTVVLVLLINTVAMADVRRDETVYTLLSADGSVAETAVVVRISGGAQDDVTEYGDTNGWKLLDGGSLPEVSADSLKWPAAAIDGSGLYYQIPTDEEAPVDVRITYRLDGQTVDPETLAGKSGRLEITLEVTNRWKQGDDYQSLLCQATFTLPGDRYSNVEGGGTQVMVGHDLTVVATLLPAPVASVTLSADVTELELEPITLQVSPGSLPLPDELEEGIDELSDGVADLNDGAQKLRDGTAELQDGADELAGGADELAGGVNSFATGIRTLYDGGADLETGLESVAGGVSDSADGAGQLAANAAQLSQGLGALATSGADLSQGLAQAADGAAQLEGGVDTLAANLTQAAQLGAQAAADAQALLGSAAPGSAEYTLLMEVSQLAAAVSGMAGGMAQLQSGAEGVESGISAAQAGLEQYGEGVGSSADGMAQMSQALADLAAGLAALDDGAAQSSQGYADYRAGVLTLLHNSYKLISGSREYADGVQTFSEQTGELTDGMSELADGTAELHEKVDEELIKNLGEGDTEPASFTDARNDAPATQIFLLRTKAVRIPEAEETPVEETQTTFWQRILALFD